MRVIPLSVLAFYIQILASFSQTPQDSVYTNTQDSVYTNRNLRTYEVNFISSYYTQDGNHSAVTGGIGTEQLTDFSTSIDLQINTTDSLNNLRSLKIEIAADAYSSASSDMIEPDAVSSPSSQDTRYYPSVSWLNRNESKHYSFGLEASFSKEYDYTSFGAGASVSKFSKDNNRELSLKLQAFFDTWDIILPIEFRGKENLLDIDLSNDKRNSFNASIVFSQIVNSRFQFAVIVDPSYQEGLLSTLYQRIYFNDSTEAVEKLPGTRYKLPAGLRMNYFLTDKLILRTFLRHYVDSWDLSAETFSIEMPYKVTPLLSLSPFYRYYTQTAVKYFAGYREHHHSEEFYTSDYDLSALNSNFIGINLLKTSLNGILGIKSWNSIELRYGYYMRSDGLNSNIIAVAGTFK